jgi:hypothetical protein
LEGAPAQKGTRSEYRVIRKYHGLKHPFCAFAVSGEGGVPSNFLNPGSSLGQAAIFLRPHPHELRDNDRINQ